MHDDSDRSFILLSHDEDQPADGRGALIPRPRNELVPKADFHPIGAVKAFNFAPVIGVSFGFVALFLLAIVGAASYGLVAQNGLVATPVVTIIDPYTDERSLLGYGPQTALEKKNFFIEARDAFIDESATFIEVDVAASQLRYFKRGVLLLSAEILSVGKPGSWWSAPSGLYEIKELEERHFSNLAQAYLPHAVRFDGNYLIHGTPVYPGGSEVPASKEIGGIRLSDESAVSLYKLVAEEIPVLVHTPPVEVDSFVYQPTVEGVTAEHYLVSDIENGTVIATSDLDAQAPIASIVKLMTAVIAAEEIDLDTRVRATAPTFVESLIPRLSDRQSVSMYSLLQLLLVESSNEAAEVVAGQIGRDEFISLMNEKARQIGMYRTTFTDPSGLDSGNVSTVGDLYRLVKYINDQRSFIFDITNTARVSTDYVGGEFGELVNFNQIEDNDTFVGGKVGETNVAGQTSVSLHEVTVQGEERVILVIVLGSEGRNADIETLLNHVARSFGE